MYLWLFPVALILLFSLGASASERKSSKILTINGRKVLVHIPENSSGRKVFYFHGNGAKIENILANLVPILDRAKDPSILIVPQLDANGFLPLADLKAIIKELNIETFGIMAHSGGIKAAIQFLNNGFTPNVGLLDALYENTDVFRKFILDPSSRTFIDIYGPTTKALSLALNSQVGNKGTFIESSVGHGSVPAQYGVMVLNSFR